MKLILWEECVFWFYLTVELILRAHYFKANFLYLLALQPALIWFLFVFFFFFLSRFANQMHMVKLINEKKRRKAKTKNGNKSWQPPSKRQLFLNTHKTYLLNLGFFSVTFFFYLVYCPTIIIAPICHNECVRKWFARTTKFYEIPNEQFSLT